MTDVDLPVRASLYARLQPWLPKSIVCVREGYGRQYFFSDLFAGITVGIIAMPLAMAFAINSGPGITPERGLYTAIIAGFICACLGGSRVSIAGPTGAFMPILYQIVSVHGYDGLAIATLMAGVMLVIMGLAKLGSMIKFIPYPVITGFTSGIAVIIFSSQMKDLFGLQMQTPASEFVYKWVDYAHAVWLHGVNPITSAVGIGGILIIVLCRRFIPRVPGPIIAVIVASALVALLHLDDRNRWGEWSIATIGTQFQGGLPRQLPSLSFGFLNSFTYDKFRELLSPAATIAMLAAIESLLCCVVADGMIGSRHRSNTELISQGLGNIGSILFGGIPATGAIARTAANIKSGGRTPLAGIIHAAVVLTCMLAFAPLAAKIPMAVFASILIVVAWNMSEIDHFKSLLSSPRSDVLVLLVTFGLTVLVDLTVAVGFGMVAASVLFMRRMSEVTNVGSLRREIDEEGDEFPELTEPRTAEALKSLPAGVEVYEINGPFFFGVADRLKDTLAQLERPPKIFILRMRRVNAIDATGLHALDEFRGKCLKQGTRLLLSGVHAQPMIAMGKYGLIDKIGEDNMCGDIDEAVEVARGILSKT